MTATTDRGGPPARHPVTIPTAPGSHARTTGPFAPRDEDRFEHLTVLLAHVAVVAVGFNYQLRFNISSGLVMAVALLPVWLPAMARFRYARVLVALWPIAIIWGLLLARSALDRNISREYSLETVFLLLSGLAALVVVLWARRVLALNRVIALYGFGLLAGTVYAGGRNWKFDLAVPVILLVLGLIERPGRRVLPAAVVLALGVFSALSEGRSLFGFCAMAGLLTLWQARPAAGTRKGSAWRTGLLMGGIAVVIYLLATNLLVRGYFGPELQARSVTQIETTGNLLLGGRPEWSATVELMRNRPMGYGIGITSDWRDLMSAREGFASIRFEPGGYASHYMFDGGFALHSIVADLWVACGLAGLVLAGAMVWSLVSSLTRLLARRRAPTSVIFAGSLALWYLAFGPIYTDFVNVCAAIGFVLIARSAPGEPDDDEDVDLATVPGDAAAPADEPGSGVPRPGVRVPGVAVPGVAVPGVKVPAVAPPLSRPR